MDAVFSDYIRSLAPGGEPPDIESFDALWRVLRRATIRELKRRGLWRAPPIYLGIYGAPSWASGDALDELLAECYVFIFIDRLERLREQLEVKDDVEGLVYRCIRNFLHNLQRKHDPLGYRIFEVVREAVREAVAAGELRILASGPRIRNGTYLGPPRGGFGEPQPAPAAAVAERVAGWNDVLLPDLVTAREPRLTRVRSELRRRLSKLTEAVGAFRFEELISPLKGDARARWSSFGIDLANGEVAIRIDPEDGVELFRWVPADRGMEDRDSFRELRGGVATAIRELDADAETRRRLLKLWHFLCVRSAEEPGAATPSARELSRRLGLPRGAVSRLMATLRELVAERCAAPAAPRSRRRWAARKSTRRRSGRRRRRSGGRGGAQRLAGRRAQGGRVPAGTGRRER